MTGAPLLLLMAVVIIAVPAEFAANKDVQGLKEAVRTSCTGCAAYDLGTRVVIGRPIGSTNERLFVLDHTGAIALAELKTVRPVGASAERDASKPAPVR